MSADLGKLLSIFSREDEERQAAQKAKALALPYINLVGFPIEPTALQIIPKEESLKYGVVSYQKANNQVRVASPVPENPNILPFLKQMALMTNLDFVPTVCSKTSLEFAIKQFDFIEPVPPGMEKLEIDPSMITGARQKLVTLAGIAAQIKSVSTSQMLEIIFGGAIHLAASDVHLEPSEKNVRLRYRIDGVLQDVVALPREVLKQIANRIKYLAKMKLDIQQAAQDGRFDIKVGDKPVDVRVSAIPGAWGEVFVMRLLDQSGKLLTLDDLGFSPLNQKVIEEAISKPHGVILNTGPTGSGKTTTLYAILQKLNSPQIKIITIEDPIEYRISGIDQTQVKPDSGYTFANALKSVLRQDPDIIMVGEVRDRDTGETAMQAALTGHLVISTLHTNSAPSAIPRLLDMGVAPFLLSGSINLIMAQRLVRRICGECGGTGLENPNNKISRRPDRNVGGRDPDISRSSGQISNKIQSSNAQNQNSPQSPNTQNPIPNSQPCPRCNGLKYKGRIAIAEVLRITPNVEKLIQVKASVSEYERAARAEGMRPMYEDGMDKVRQGVTTEEEVLRVTEEEGVARPTTAGGRK